MNDCLFIHFFFHRVTYKSCSVLGFKTDERWSGLLGMLQTSKVDFVAGYKSMTSERSEVANYLTTSHTAE